MKYIVTSDIHVGHRKTPTKHIITSFVSNILTEANADADVLFINGDLFDRLLYLNTPEAQQVIHFFHHLLDYCYINDILLRVLEGTPSHDYFQSSTLFKMNEIRTNKVKLKYFRTLDIEYMEEFNKHILYIPDEWCSDQHELERQINQKLSLMNISKVDMAMLHGSFKYQTKGMVTHAFSFDEEYFLNLVTGFIHIGHHHNYTNFDRIVANGSLERLAHGEEEDKGYVIVNDSTYVFMANPLSYIYKTIQVTAKTTLASLDKQIYKYPKESHIRLQMKNDHEYNSIFTDIKARYPDYYIKKLVKDASSDANSVTYILSEDVLELSENLFLDTNIKEALQTLILTKHSLTASEEVKMKDYLQVFDSVRSEETLLT